MNEELRSYVEQTLNSGLSEDEIRKKLLDQGGWSNDDLDVVFQSFAANADVPKEPMEPTNERLKPKNATPLQSEQPNNQQTFSNTPLEIVAEESELTESIESIKPLSSSKLLLILGVILGIVLIGGSVFAFTKLGLFSTNAPYDESNLISGLLLSFTDIKAFSNTITGELKVEPRDDDAKPFSIEEPDNIEQLRKRYANDSMRFGDVQDILSSIKYKTPLFSSIDQIKSELEDQSYRRKSVSVSDPVTGQNYIYKTVGADDFELVITFETNAAIKEIRGAYDFDDTKTKIRDKTVSFTKESSTLYYFSSKPPKPYLEEIGAMSRYLPPEFLFNAMVSVDSDSRDSELANWKFAVDVSGELGDLTYKFAGDAIKKDEDFYVRVRNFPGIFGISIGNIKGTWIKISKEFLEDEWGSFLYGFDSISEVEEEYKENREDLVRYIREIAGIADDVKLLSFRKEPIKVEIDGVDLFKYDLEPNKEAIIPFIERAIEASEGYENFDADLIADEALLEYLKSTEFDQVFEYIKNNTSLILWVKKDGSVQKIQYSIRAVPPDTAIQLRDKQIRLTLKIVLGNIDEPVKIKPPKDFKDAKEVLEEFQANRFGSRELAKDASTKSSMQTIRIMAELYFDDQTPSTYGPTSNNCSIGMFSDEDIEKVIISITEEIGESPKCRINNNSFAISAKLLDDPEMHWCIDSTGIAQTISLPGLADNVTSCK